MILDPYLVLDLPREAGDEAIRSRYLELVRKHPPDREPARFQAIREAYELVRDEERRVRFALFYCVRNPDLKANLEAIAWKPKTRRTRLRAALESLKARR